MEHIMPNKLPNTDEFNELLSGQPISELELTPLFDNPSVND